MREALTTKRYPDEESLASLEYRQEKQKKAHASLVANKAPRGERRRAEKVIVKTHKKILKRIKAMS